MQENQIVAENGKDVKKIILAELCPMVKECPHSKHQCTPGTIATFGCLLATEEIVREKTVTGVFLGRITNDGSYLLEGPWYETLKKTFSCEKDFRDAERAALALFTKNKFFKKNGRRH